jgi:hypothetical protein
LFKEAGDNASQCLQPTPTVVPVDFKSEYDPWPLVIDFHSFGRFGTVSGTGFLLFVQSL